MMSVKRLRSYLPWVLTIAAYLIVQIPAVNSGVFPADDAEEFAFVYRSDSFWQLLGADVFGLFRPVKNLLFFLFARILPGMFWGRVFSIGIGILSYFCVFGFFDRLQTARWKVHAISAIWLLAPTLVSSVVWLSCVNIQLMCAFVALSFRCHCEKDRPGWMASGIWLFLALVSYENAVACGPLFFVIDFILYPERLKRRSTWLGYCGYAAIIAGYLALRHFVGSSTSVFGSFDGVSRQELAITSAYFTCQHFLSWLWPFGRFMAFGGFCHGEVSSAVILSCWAVIAVMAALVLVLRKRRAASALGLAMALVGFIPVSNLLGLGNGPYGDYYLGISSMGLAIVVVDLMSLCAGWQGTLRCLGWALLVVLAGWRLMAAIEAINWATWWGDGEKAYAISARNFPKVFSNHQKLAEIAFNAGNYDVAIEECNAAEAPLSRDSSQRESTYQIRALVAIVRDKDAETAMKYLDMALAVARQGVFDARYHQFRGYVFEDLLNDAQQARKEYEQSLAIELGVSTIEAANRLACLLAVEGDWDNAFDLWEKALRICPDNAAIIENLDRAKRLRQ